MKNGKINKELLNQVTDEVLEKKAAKIAATVVEDVIQHLARAIEGTFVEEHGYGKKRFNRLINQLNYRLPEHLQFSVVDQKEKITQDRLYDVIELLLDFKCNEKCRKRSYQKCFIYNALNTRDVPIFEASERYCPYRVVPGDKISAEEIEKIQVYLRDKGIRLENN